MDFGNITTNIIKNGLVFNMDAANRASTIPSTSTTKTFNTVDTAISGTFAADAQYDSSTISPSFAFDGTGDDIDCSSPSFLNNLNQLTVSTWINSNNKGNDDGVVSWWATSANRSFTLNLETSGNIRFAVFNSGGTIAASYINTSDWSTGNWYNVTGTYDGSNVKLYLNSILKDTVSLTGQIRSVTATLFIANYYDESKNYNGNIGPVQIYNRTLSANEVLHNYNALKGRFA